MATSSILHELHWRGLVADMANRDELEKLLAPGAAPATLYVGFDPTADSLHLGNLMGLLLLRRFQQAGHLPIALAGGATGMIGDPSGKSAERNLLSVEDLEKNIAGQSAQLRRFLDFDTKTNPARVVNNADWMRPISILDFLRDVGKHFSVNAMVAKDSVKSRMEGESGISFTEFSYSLLQAYDFLHLYEKYGCRVQGGGADQWGNIVAGTDLVRRKLGATVCGLTTPLLTKTDGTKFGKTETGAVWLSASRTSVYRFYQFLIQVEDAQVIQLLKFFTFLPQEDIDALAAQHQATPERRDAHKKLPRRHHRSAIRRSHRRGPQRHPRAQHPRPTRRRAHRSPHRGGLEPLQRPGAKRHRSRRHQPQQRPRHRHQARPHRRPPPLRQIPPPPQRQTELCPCAFRIN